MSTPKNRSVSPRERAERLIMDANWMLGKLESLLETDKNSKLPFYNWIKES